jgi:hypothetical protein
MWNLPPSKQSRACLVPYDAGVYLACPVHVLDASPLPRWPSQTRVQGGFVDWRGAKNKAQRQKPGPGDLEEVL